MKRLTIFLLFLGILGFCWTKVMDFQEQQTIKASQESDKLFHENNDVYAQLKVDGTAINYLVAQQPEDCL